MGSPEIRSATARPRERPCARLAVSLAGALAVHAAVLAALAGAGAFLPPRPPQPIALAPLSARAWEANRALAPAAPPRAADAAADPPPRPSAATTTAPRPAPPEPEPEGQVVAVAPSQDSRPPDRARFLSDRDNRVERETRARVTGRFDTPAPRAIRAAAGGGAARGGELGEAEESRAGAPGAPAEAAAAVAAAPPDGAGPGTGEARRRAALAALRTSAEGGEDGARRAGAYDPRLLPTAAALGELAGGPSDDALDGVPEGDATFLDTRGWRYAEFMNRVKREVSAAWDPETPLARHDPEGRLDRRGTWTTSLAVVLDAAGGLKRVEVRRPSGREYLDAAAIEAFRRAQPFPNPPRGLVDAKGEVRFRFGLRYRPPEGPGLGAAASAILSPGPGEAGVTRAR